MSENKSEAILSTVFILRALAGWLISAAVLLPLASLILCKTVISSSALGYVSSGLSFCCALFAGAYASRGEQGALFFKALISSGIISIILLSLGFLMQGRRLEPSSVLSTVSFTFSGLLLSSVMFPVKRTAGRRKKFRRKK